MQYEFIIQYRIHSEVLVISLQSAYFSKFHFRELISAGILCKDCPIALYLS